MTIPMASSIKPLYWHLLQANQLGLELGEVVQQLVLSHEILEFPFK